MKYELISEKEYNPFIPSEIRDIIFHNRGIDTPIEFMTPSEDHLINPFLLDNITEGVNLLKDHLDKNNTILLIVDSDVDGFTSASFLYNYLKHSFSLDNLHWMVHSNKAHGINMDKVKEINPSLVICPDSSSNEYEKHKELKDNNIDILVIDHHEAPKYSEDAVVINNQLSEKYENKYLSGVGVVFKFCQAMDSMLNCNYSMNFLDLAALGVIADMMDVRHMENRYIITEGLKTINNPFFKALIKKQTYSLGSQPINAIGIMFYISPLINAVTRVGTLEERQTMFKAFIEGEELVSSSKRGAKDTDKETIAEKATREASNARNRQKKLVDEIKENVELTLDCNKTKDSPVLLVKLDEICNKNLTGLVANQLANKYKRPVLLLIDQGDDNYLGSGRNYGFSEVKELKDSLTDTKLFDFAEGHQSAFGAKINEENIETFIEKIEEFFPNIENLDDTYNVDFIFNGEDFDIGMIREIARLRPLWGKGFDEPLIAVKNIHVNGNNLQIMGQKSKHLKFICKNITYIKFHVSEEEIAKFKDRQMVIDIVGRCGVNIFRDQFDYQVIIQDYEIMKEKDEFAF